MTLQEQICPICNEGQIEQRVGESWFLVEGLGLSDESYFLTVGHCCLLLLE